MNTNKKTQKILKAEEPSVAYEASIPKFKGVDRETFDFYTEFKKGFTVEEAKAESIRKIKEWWGK